MTGWRRLALLLGLAGCIVTGCGIQPTGVVGGGPAVSVPGREGGVELCLLESDRLHAVERFDVVLDGGGVPVEQDWEEGWGLSSWPDLTKIGNLLALGPKPEEDASGLASEVPTSLRLRLVTRWFAPELSSDDLPGEDKDRLAVEGLARVGTVVGVDESTTVVVLVDEPVVERVSRLAARQVACTVELYLDRLEDDRDVILVDVFGQAYGDTLGVTGLDDR